MTVRNTDKYNELELEENIEVSNSENGDAENVEKKEKKRKRFYPSNTYGHKIVNAITGVPYPWTVGSKYENVLWKVCDARCYERGECDFYFYDSPSQALKHRKLHSDAYSPESIKEWEDRCREFSESVETEWKSL